MLLLLLLIGSGYFSFYFYALRAQDGEYHSHSSRQVVSQQEFMSLQSQKFDTARNLTGKNIVNSESDITVTECRC